MLSRWLWLLQALNVFVVLKEIHLFHISTSGKTGGSLHTFCISPSSSPQEKTHSPQRLPMQKHQCKKLLTTRPWSSSKPTSEEHLCDPPQHLLMHSCGRELRFLRVLNCLWTPMLSSNCKSLSRQTITQTMLASRNYAFSVQAHSKTTQKSAEEFSLGLLEATKAKATKASRDSTEKKEATVLHQGTNQPASRLEPREREIKGKEGFRWGGVHRH